MQYLARGYHAVILRYSVAPARYPLALMQLAKTVAYLREHAGEFHIDTDKIILQGVFLREVIWQRAWRILEGKIHLRSSAYRCGNGEAKWNDPQLSGHYIWKICAYGFF